MVKKGLKDQLRDVLLVLPGSFLMTLGGFGLVFCLIFAELIGERDLPSLCPVYPGDIRTVNLVAFASGAMFAEGLRLYIKHGKKRLSSEKSVGNRNERSAPKGGTH